MFSVSFSCIIQSLLSKFIGSVKLDYGTQWSKLNKPYSIKISGIHAWMKTCSPHYDEHTWWDLHLEMNTCIKIQRKFVKDSFWRGNTTSNSYFKNSFSRCILYLMPVNFDILSANICFTHHVLYWMEIMDCLWWTHSSRSWTETRCSWPAVCTHHTGSPCCLLGH